MSKHGRSNGRSLSLAHARRLKRSALMLSAGVLAIAVAKPASAQVAPGTLPTGGTVVGGSATIGTPSGAALTIAQASDRAVINWNSFDIGSGASVTFNQPSATSIAVNRVTSGVAPSQIAGTLTANGIVAVLNPNGVMFAGTANVDVGGLIASTGDIDTGAFMAGGNLLGITGADQGEIVVTAGAGITVQNAGLAAFVAPSVRNSGTITATAGRVQLAAGTAFTLDLANDGLLAIGVGASSPLVENHGSIFAAGGAITLSARQASGLIDQTIRTGVLPVGSARLDGDTIVLDATGSDIEIASNITGSGDLTVSGNRIWGAGDINVDGNLTLNVNAGGAIADTTIGASNWIQDALGVIGAPVDATTINLGAGLYRPGVALNASNVTLDGLGAARIGWVSGIENAIDVRGDNVTIRNLEIFGPATSAYTSFAWGATNSRGIFAHNGADNVSLLNNNIHDIRTGIILDGRNLNGVVSGNSIDNTKSAISVQYTDGSNLTMAGNREGANGNEWGINVHLNGILQPNGSINPSTSLVGGVSVGVLGAANLTEQQRILALSNANTGMAVQNLAYSASNRTRAFVTPTGGAVTQGSLLSALGSVQAGVNAVVAGGSVFVLPGEYTEGVTGVDLYGGTGGQTFGLYVAKDNVTIRGVDASGQAITSADNVAAYVTAANQAGFGAQHFVSGSGVTIEGLGFRPRAGANGRKTLEVTGDAFTLRNSVIDNRGNPTEVNFYISDFDDVIKPRVESFTLENNIFYGGTTASTMVLVAGGTGRTTDAANRIFSGNRIFGSSLTGQSGFRIEGQATATAPWAVLTTGAVTITNNRFDNVDAPIRTLGTLTQGLDWNAVFRTNGNIFVDGAVLAYDGSSLNARAGLNAFGDLDFRITSRIADSVARAVAGDTVRMLDGTYNLGTSRLVIDKSISLVGQSEAGTIIDGRGIGAGLGTMLVSADNTTLSHFTLYGADSGVNNYGIKVQPNSAAYNPNQRLLNFAINDVTVRGSTRAELDLNGVIGATITNFTADGRRVANNAETAGAGIQITDSANITLTNVETLGNLWGSVALYQANKSGAYNGQTTNINIDAASNSFGETLGVFTQLESTTQGFGQLNLTGFGYAVRNTDHRPDTLDGQFTFFRTDLADATAFALGVGVASASSIEGYSGTAFTNIFTVSSGLSINAATRDARAGGTINVGAGTYAETVKLTQGLTLAGAGMDATSITGGVWLSTAMSNVVLKDFTVSGQVNTSNRTISNQGITTNLTVDGVRIDGLGLTGRNGLVGGQIAGAVSVTNSEFVNIRGFQAFDTGSSTGNNAITSGTFSDNILDNTVGSIAFRPDPAMNATITIADNVVTNVGSTTDNVGAVFKVFGGATVNFTGNQVSDVGITNAATSGGPAAGAVLVVRNANLLNVTDNIFTNNNQVFAVDNAANLPTVTNFAGNSFVNNGTAIYISTNYLGSGTINFGAGNNFVAGADTGQHIVWRSGGALDLTQVAFNGVQASAMTLGELFAAEDRITHAVDRVGSGLATLVSGNLYVTTSATDNALRAVAAASPGATINLSAGTHVLTNTLFLQKSVSVLGQGKDLTTINASGHNAYGVRVHADNVSLADFTVLGSSAAVGNSNYGIKVEAGNGDANARNDNFAIRDVAISGSRKTGLDLNAVIGGVIDGVTVTGVTNGNGIAITDSADVTVRNTTTSGNAWGGLALYQSNNLGGGGSVQQLTDITVTDNNFGEANGLYLQDSSTLLDPGALNIQGFAFTVRNPAHRADGAQFTFFRTAVQDALDFAVNLNPAFSDASVVEGWTGSADSGEFVVGFGSLNGGGVKALSLQSAFDASADGDSINIGSGIYGQSATLNGARALTFGEATFDALTLNGAGTSIGGTLTSTGGLTLGAVTLTGATSLTAGGALSLGGASGGHALVLAGDTVTIGAIDTASLTASGTNIVTAGATTSGAQSYSGATTLAGTYTASSFAVSGASVLGDDTSIAADTVTLGAIAGAKALMIDASGDVALGNVQGLADLTVAGGAISTAGASTTGGQSYTGSTLLDGDYSAAALTVNGAALLGGDTSISGGSVTLGTIAGARALMIDATGSVALGAASGLASLDVIGATISTVGVTTSGGQSYAGATTLTGDYDATSFAIAGGTTLAGDTEIAADSVTLGTIDGARALTIDAASAVGLGAAAGLASLDVTAATIVTAGVTTSGAQNYAGATTLAGGYDGASLTVTGAATLAGDTDISANTVTLGAIGGAQALTIDAAGAVALGPVSGLTSLLASGATIATVGVTTTGLQSYTGATSLSGAYATGGGAFTIAGAASLGGSTSVNSGSGALAMGQIGGAHALTLAGGAVTLGTVQGLESLAVTGVTIASNGAITSGAQSYTGTTTLAGGYATAGASFTVDGNAALGATTSIGTAGGALALGALGGAHGLTLSGGAVMLGAVDGLTSLEVTGATIVSNGAITAGAQSYTGATSLSGAYASGGAGFVIDGATTLSGATTLATGGGDASLGALGGANSLVLDAGGGSVALGAVDGLASLSVTAANIATAGATTSGAQSYSGATSLNGAYSGSGFTVAGATTLGGATTVSTGGGDASFGAVGGANSLAIDAGGGSAALGAVDGLTSLDIMAANIATAGATTSGAQSYSGATSLNGAYSGSGFTVMGATILGGATTVSTGGGDASFDVVSGANSLVLDAGGGSVALGAVDGLASLSVTAANIATAGATTSGAQSYSGATSLNGAYAGSAFTVTGATTLGGATTVSTGGGNAQLGAVGGASSLAVNAGGGSATIGAVTGLSSLGITAANIVTAGAATSGAQTYTGATSLNGAYATGGASFTVAGAATLAGATTVASGNGAIGFGAINGAGAGGQALGLNAGTGAATLGAIGETGPLGAVAVNAGQTVLGGATVRGASLTFTGGAGATLRLTQATTTFTTAGGAITIQPDLIGTVNAQQNVVFAAGLGDVTIGNAGTDAIRLGSLTVNGHDFNAQTVKLAGDYDATLSGSQVFSANTLDTLASVRAVVAGVESGPIRAGGAVTIEASGSGSGSIIAGGPVSLGYVESVSRAITSTGPVSIASGGSISGAIVSGGAVELATVAGAVTSNVNASGPVSVGSTSGNIVATIVSTGPVSVASGSGTVGGAISTSGAVTIASTSGSIASVVNAGGATSVSSGTGSVGGSITSTGAVTITTVSGTIAPVVTAGGATSVSSTSGSVGGTISGTGAISVVTNGAIGGTINSGGGAITLTSELPVNVQVNGSVVTVKAPGGTVTGVFSEIKTDDGGTFVVNDAPVIGAGTTDARQILIDSFLAPVGATVSPEGEIQLPVGLALGLIAPAGRGEGQRPPVLVNNVARLGELLRLGYTAIIIDLDESGLDIEEELIDTKE